MCGLAGDARSPCGQTVPSEVKELKVVEEVRVGPPVSLFVISCCQYVAVAALVAYASVRPAEVTL